MIAPGMAKILAGPPPSFALGDSLSGERYEAEALYRYYASGTVRSRTFATSSGPNGQKVNGPDGTPGTVEWYEGGQVGSHQYYVDGLPGNGPNGEPSYQKWDVDGFLIKQEYREGGKLSDGPNGEPAFQFWTAEKRRFRKTRHVRRRQIRYQGGRIQDGANGEPAELAWDIDGHLVVQAFYHNDMRHDSASGEPAIWLMDEDNRIVSSSNYINGEEIRPEDSLMYRNNPVAYRVVTDTGISHGKFMEIVEDCGGDIETAATLASLMI